MNSIKLSIAAMILFVALSFLSCRNENCTNWVEEALRDAEEKAFLMAKEMDNHPGQLPRSIDMKGNLLTSGPEWWCSGFFPGVLWYLHENNRNEQIKYYASKMTNRINKEQYNTSTHDLGFMLYCSYGNAWRLTQEDSYRSVLLNGSKSLSTRFNPVVGCIQSWEASEKWSYPVIIDNMMNLEILMWAYKEFENEEFKNICINHADKTLQNQFRQDNSSYHVVSYLPETGALEFQGTDQGYSNESAWARGQAWGLYGFTMMYRETKNSIYLEQANKIARFILEHKNLPEDKIPYWDLDSPNIPNDYRDSSSAAIIASALLELSGYVSKKIGKEYFTVAEKQLKTLASSIYTAKTGTNGNFILKHGVGNIPQNSEIDTPLSYGDYYYVEALLRYKKHTFNNQNHY